MPARAAVTVEHARLSRIVAAVGKALILVSALVDGADLFRHAPFYAGLVFVVASYCLEMFFKTKHLALKKMDGGGLVLHSRNNTRKIATRSITGAYVVRRETPVVEIDLVGGDRIAMRMADMPSAERFVSGLGPRRTRIPLAKPARRLLHLLFLVPAVLGAGLVESVVHLPSVLLPLLMLVLYELMRHDARAPVFTIGDDGVLVESGFSPNLFRYSAIASVALDDARGAIRLHLRTGRAITVGGRLLDDGRRHAVAALLHDRLAARTSIGDASSFERGDRSVTAWREHFRRVLAEPGYRTTSLSVDHALQVVDSASTTPEQRIGAALALRLAGESQRVRVAADGAADANLRMALEAVADEDDEQVEKAIRHLG